MATKTGERRPRPARAAAGALTSSEPATPEEPGRRATTMRAIVQDRYGSPDVLALREVDRPEVGHDDVLVRVRAAGVHIGDWHLVADYARLLALTPGHLNHLAKAATGQAASALIDARLLLEAKRLLAHSDATVDQIARDLGFRDASYFGRHFRRHVGQPPGAFRATIHEKYRNDH